MIYLFLVQFYAEPLDRLNAAQPLLISLIIKIVCQNAPFSGAQSQLVCSGCRNLLVYPVGATSVCCAVCNAVTSVPPPGMMQFLLTRSLHSV